MSPIISAKEAGPAPRKSRKRQRRRRATSTDNQTGLEASVDHPQNILGGPSGTKESLEGPRRKMMLIWGVFLANRYAALEDPLPKSAQSSGSMETPLRIHTPAVKARRVTGNKGSIWPPPQSKFTFLCSRPASTTAQFPTCAGLRKDTPVGISAPLLPETGVDVVKSLRHAPKPSPIAEIALNEKTPSDYTTFSAGTSSIPTPVLDLPKDSMLVLNNAMIGWPEPTPSVKAPSTRDGKSRFFPITSTSLVDLDNLRPHRSGEKSTKLATCGLEFQKSSRAEDEPKLALRGSEGEGAREKMAVPVIMVHNTAASSPRLNGGTEHGGTMSLESINGDCYSKSEELHPSMYTTSSMYLSVETGWEGLEEGFWTCG
ncbi:hypothetical protein MMC13_005834 [Lambiella insularis]|nr:hypothetical protein [Lambiella insularis]